MTSSENGLLYTVILGVSFGQVLSELAIAVREWSGIRRDGPRPAMRWRIFLLALIVEVWLAATYYRGTVTEISILELVAFLVVPAAILIMSFLLPESRHDPGPDGGMPRRPLSTGSGRSSSGCSSEWSR